MGNVDKIINNKHSNLNKHMSKNPIQKFLIKNYYKYLLKIIKKENPRNVLDVGCGEGFTLDLLIKNKIGNKIIGIDNSRESIRIGRMLFPKLEIIHGNIYNIPFPDNSFDLVICTEVFEHLDNPVKALAEIRRVSKNHFVLSVPNEPIFMLSNFLRGKNIRKLGNDPEHINHWTMLTFKKFLNKNHTSVLKMIFPFPWILALCKK